MSDGAEGADHLLGRVVDERYRIERRLGEGGIGRVYVAKHISLGREVALKVLLGKYATMDVLKQRFAREAEALAALSHPNIVTVTDFGVFENNPYIVMELLEGRDLSHLLAGPPLEPKRVLDIVRQTLRALAYAHQRDLVHRDLKPHNIFVRDLGDGADHVSVLDFGLARFVGDAAKGSPKLTHVGALIGTPAYMAPEQASGEEVDGRADIYAMGCVIYEALTGRRLFVANDPASLLRMHLLETPPLLSQADPGLSVGEGLQALVSKCLEKRPEARYANVAEMITALEALGPEPAVRIGERPSRSRPISTVAATQAPGATRAATPQAIADDAMSADHGGFSEIRVPQSRGPLLLAVGCVALLLLGALTGVGLWWTSRDEPEPVADAPEVPLPEPAPAPVARPPARNPFDAALPNVLADIHQRVERGDTIESEQALRWANRINEYQHENTSDPVPHLLLAHIKANQGWFEQALPEYEYAYRLDATVRGDPQMLGDLIRMAQGADPPEASAFIARAYGPEATAPIAAAIAEGGLDEAQRERLTNLMGELVPAP